MNSTFVKSVAVFLPALFFCFLQPVGAQGNCFCVGTSQTGTDFADAISQCTPLNICSAGFVCPPLQVVCAAASVVTSSALGVTVNCGLNPQSITCVAETSSGNGDPHLTGFDGLRFDFHGIHGKNYAVFGRPSGDMLVTKMKETQRSHHASGAKATFFDEFGLQIADSNDHVKVYLARNSLQGGQWLPIVEVNGKEIRDTLKLKSCRVKFRSGDKWVSIITMDSKFIIFAGHPEDESLHHLNIKIELVRSPSISERYIGILGTTLNRALGHVIHPDLDVTGRPETLETAMRGRFQVESLFPRRNNGHDMMLTGVVRILSNIKHAEKTWSAGTV